MLQKKKSNVQFYQFKKNGLNVLWTICFTPIFIIFPLQCNFLSPENCAIFHSNLSTKFSRLMLGAYAQKIARKLSLINFRNLNNLLTTISHFITVEGV